jgi:iron complex transport system permease protein
MKLATQKQATRGLEPKHAPKKRQRLSHILTYVILSGLLLTTIVLATSFGSVSIPFSIIVRILLNGTGLFHFARQWDATVEIIVWQVRMPVVIGAALVGAALAVSGVLFQGMLRNPLADPFLIGTSSGAALGATIAFVLPFATFYGTFFPLTMVLAFLGALVTIFFVYGIARSGGRTPVVTLLLAGVVVNAVLVALQTLILALFPREEFQLQALFNWLSGGIQVTTWLPLGSVAIVVVLGMVLALSLARVLDSLTLGEESASHLGLNVEYYKFVIVVTASCLTAAAVSISGLVGFVGLVTPHVMRLLLGPNHRTLLPASALGGAIFLTLADLLARIVVAPAVLPVGVFTALVGAPFFLLLLRRSRRDYRW